MLIRENDFLKTQIQALEQSAADTLVQHNVAIKKMNDAHTKKENENLATQDTLKHTHADRLTALIKEREAD